MSYLPTKSLYGINSHNVQIYIAGIQVLAPSILLSESKRH